ncbi:hypothetical protein FRC17_001582 [Serendipita sp. 399]|nr:hypothetical protein FRC17_001582 [Serendipita sp. 399]
MSGERKRSIKLRIPFIGSKPDNSKSKAATLPNEILLQIFRGVERLRMDCTEVGRRPNDHVRSLPLVCRMWFDAGQTVLYELVEFPTVSSVFKFHRTLVRTPRLCKLVRTLILPGRLGKRCPEKLHKTMIQIVGLVSDNLEELHVATDVMQTSPEDAARMVLPIPVGAHPNLTSLELFSTSHALTALPNFVQLGLSNLQSLAFHGFALRWERSFPYPILPHLTSISFVSCHLSSSIISVISAHPNLKKITWRKTAVTPFIELVGVSDIVMAYQGTITHLDLDRLNEDLGWLKRASGLQHLVISYGLFSTLLDVQSYPPDLRTLVIRVPIFYTPEMSHFESFATSGIQNHLDQLTIDVCKHHTKLLQHKEQLTTLLNGGTMRFLVDDSRACRCMAPVIAFTGDLLHPVAKYGWSVPFLAAAALDQAQMDGHLAAGAALLGSFEQSTDPLAGWMSSQPDSTSLTSLSIPGTHDSLTWNVTGIVAAFTRTQDISLFKQLDGGVRFIDLRIGEVNGMVNLYHGSVRLDETAQLGDIFWGLYRWLDAHSTETVVVSVKVDNGTSTASLQQTVYDLVTGPDVRDYWVQSAALPTLGEARHKAVLLRRFAFDQLQSITPIGIDASLGWSDNNAAFSIVYGPNSETIYIEDFYNVEGTDVAAAVASKYAALSANLDLATGGQFPDQLFLSYASGYSGINVNPASLAQGSGGVQGVNSMAISYLAGKRGARFGVVLFDFFGSDSRLAPAVLSQEVDVTASPTGVATPSSTSTGSHGGGYGSNAATSSISLPYPISVSLIAVAALSLLSF